jgi:hypothetical protein
MTTRGIFRAPDEGKEGPTLLPHETVSMYRGD